MGAKKNEAHEGDTRGAAPLLPSACYTGYTWPIFETEAWDNPEMAYFSRLFSQSIRGWSKTFSQGRIPLALMTCLNFSSGIWLWFVSLKLDINWRKLLFDVADPSIMLDACPIRSCSKWPYLFWVCPYSWNVIASNPVWTQIFFLCPMPLKWRSLLIQQSFLAPRRPGARKDGCVFRIDMTRITCFPDAEI